LEGILIMFPWNPSSCQSFQWNSHDEGSLMTFQKSATTMLKDEKTF